MTLHEAIVYLLDDFHLGDKIYEVRARAVENNSSYQGNSWDHPAVTRFNEAVMTLETWRKTETSI